MAIQIPSDPDTKLRRRETADALSASGYPTAPATLSTMASRGGGPPYVTYGKAVLYRWGDALAWAQSRLSAPRRSTSEADEQERTATNGRRPAKEAA